MKALVAGGAGFLGSHLCDRLLAEGHSVICADNLITGTEGNLAHLRGEAGFTFLRHDVTEPLDVTVDLIFHLASPASPNPASAKSYLAHPIETALANSLGTHRLLETARACGARFLMASTSEVYGDPTRHPQAEDYWGNVNPTGIRSCYDESKRFAEALSMSYLRQYGLDVRLARIFNTYGPRCDPLDGRLVPNFITQALAHEPITVFGDGRQTRSLCYVADLIEGLWRTMVSDAARGEVFNIGNPEEHTVLEYAQLVRKLCDSRSEIVFLPLPADDPQRRRPDVTKARAILGWEPKVSLLDGLRRTIEWYRDGRSASNDD